MCNCTVTFVHTIEWEDCMCGWFKKNIVFATLPHGQSHTCAIFRGIVSISGGWMLVLSKELIMAEDSPHYINIFVQGITIYLDVLLLLLVCCVTAPGKPLLTVFPHQLISIPSFCCSHCVCVCVCVCFHKIPYVNCFGRTVLYVCIEYCI